PFDQQAIEALQDDEIRRVLYAPGAGDLHDYFAAILSGRPDGALHQALPYAAASLEPVTDDRPFFNLLQPWRAIGIEHFAAIFASGEQARMRLEDLPIAQVSVLLLLAALTLFAAAASLPTLRGLGRAGIPPREATLVGLPFACYGLAYIVIE